MVKIATAIVIVLAFMTECVYACPCGPQLTNNEKFFMVKLLDGCPCWQHKSVEQAYRHANGVFIGKVIDIENGEYKILTLVFKYEQVTLDVIKTYKGNVHNGNVIFMTGIEKSECGFPFILNKTYLVYGLHYKGNQYSTNACTRDKEIGPGITKELKSLEKLKKIP